MPFALVVYDVLYLTLAVLLYGTSLAAGAAASRFLSGWLAWPFALVLGGVPALLVLVALAGAATAVCPRLRPGKYVMFKGSTFWSWVIRSMVRRLLFAPGLKWFLLSSNVLRFLAFRALGAKVAFTASTSADIDVLDPGLLLLGPGVVIGARALISGHLMLGNKLVLGTVCVEERALISAEVAVSPGVTVGKRADIKARAALGPFASIGEGASVGAECTVDAYANVDAGASLPIRAYVPRRGRIRA